MQYKAPKDANSLSLKAHGNSNKKNEPYYRTKADVLWKAKAAAQTSETPKHIVGAIEQEAGGVLNVSSPEDIIRNREQVYNACWNVEGRKNVGTDKILSAWRADKLMNLMQHDDVLRVFVYRKKPDKYPMTLAAMMTSVTKEGEGRLRVPGFLVISQRHQISDVWDNKDLKMSSPSQAAQMKQPTTYTWGVLPT